MICRLKRAGKDLCLLFGPGGLNTSVDLKGGEAPLLAPSEHLGHRRAQSIPSLHRLPIRLSISHMSGEDERKIVAPSFSSFPSAPSFDSFPVASTSKSRLSTRQSSDDSAAEEDRKKRKSKHRDDRHDEKHERKKHRETVKPDSDREHARSHKVNDDNGVEYNPRDRHRKSKNESSKHRRRRSRSGSRSRPPKSSHRDQEDSVGGVSDNLDCSMTDVLPLDAAILQRSKSCSWRSSNPVQAA